MSCFSRNFLLFGFEICFLSVKKQEFLHILSVLLYHFPPFPAFWLIIPAFLEIYWLKSCFCDFRSVHPEYNVKAKETSHLPVQKTQLEEDIHQVGKFCDQVHASNK
jgi:hypothetical protein